MVTLDGEYRIAVLHQAAPTPAIGGVLKPVKPGGYKDSSADLAYALHLESQDACTPSIKLITPSSSPDPSKDADWSFGDYKETILEVIEKHGANVLWANTNVHSAHALLDIAKQHPDILMVGQDPRHVDNYDDKAWVNRWLQSHAGLEGTFPQTWIVPRDTPEVLASIPLPVIIKPVRGRGSQGVAYCRTSNELEQRAKKLWETGSRVVIEEFCSGEEVTITVLPPGTYDPPVGVKDKHWALPVVRRFDHTDGIMPYSGGVPVTANSTLVPLEEASVDPEYARLQKRCELVGQALGTLATIRIDARRRGQTASGMDREFALFDTNMKPNITGPGRPGRDDQAALTVLAAGGLGWSYRDLVRNMLRQAVKLRCLL
ncbi:hypothetical protein PUNSTDRAFT_96537 [Punctularia strigosozonata HHB-11173 SS5]|uniref:uncharacterized protein n=1 Tax=Punctularia strigosozonata (strain HHB-11173) TaxID=741275 RepID=UPI00044181A7|nr:uncharacterized protein PUNSTDRAFT_96537 [Punctularia strigosozonata HHB-11173 SS5]EIN14576.1 hypothetical protein PUNSTDRAFT_96537 [Punctularia strigosozonata HHB-11173 SS5]